MVIINPGRGRKGILPLLIILIVSQFFFSCATMGSMGEKIPIFGKALGVFNTAIDSISKTSGVAKDAWKNAFEDITPEQEYYIGRAVAANILSSYKIQANWPNTTAYLNRICRALVINSPRPEIYNEYHVAVLDSDEINAFATPGGHIFLTRALVNSATSEDTLAAVVAHELSHIQLQHGLKAIKNARGTQAVLSSVNIVTGTVGEVVNRPEVMAAFNDSINDMVSTMVTRGYSQVQEFNADSVAMSLMALAGYEPSSLMEMLMMLEKNQSGKSGGFINTHPTPAQRITNAQKTVGNYEVPDTRSYREARYKAIR